MKNITNDINNKALKQLFNNNEAMIFLAELVRLNEDYKLINVGFDEWIKNVDLEILVRISNTVDTLNHHFEPLTRNKG